MTKLTDDGRRIVQEVATRHGLSVGAVEQMAQAIARGGGSMAQFDIAELGGSGQWMAGGMTMVGNMFDNALKARVDGLCQELAGAMEQGRIFERPPTFAGAPWWPEELGEPASVGGQNAARYAYFPAISRIAFDPGNGAPVILLDTGDHRIGGWSQQQAGPGDPFLGVTFSSQHGQFPLTALRRADGAQHTETAPGDARPAAPSRQSQHQSQGGPPAPRPAPAATADAPEPISAHKPPTPALEPAPMPQPASSSADEVLNTIQKLAALRDAGAVTDEEFAAKKAELLKRL